MDDRTVGLVLRALRLRRGMRQSDVAARTGCSQALVSRVEAGRIDATTVGTLRRLFGALDARVRIVPGWQGADLERLLDADHARLVAATATRLERRGWEVALEVTYSEFGERGSIDLLGLRPAARAVLVVEVKSDIPSTESMGRKVDEKARLGPGIIERPYGWRPAVVGRIVVLPETSRLRRLVAAVPAIRRMFPDDRAALRHWLRTPVGTIAGLWFLSRITPMHRRAGRRGIPRAREGR